MQLIIGLGNPEKKFENTWHNIGFIIIEKLQSKLEDFSHWEKEKNLSSEISKGIINNEKIILAKPLTFMNLSGKAVKLLLSYFFNSKIKELSKHLWIIHDDIDLPLGKIKIVKNRGTAGHKGLESIIKELKISKKNLGLSQEEIKNFVRFRVGIQPKNGKPKNMENFVIKKFNNKDKETIKEIIEKTTEAIEFSLKQNIDRAMNKFNN